MKKSTVYSHKCDWCNRELILNGPDSDSYVVTAAYQYFCIIQTPGKPAERDCMADYLNSINEKIIKKAQNLEIKERPEKEKEKLEKEKRLLEKPRVLAKLAAYQKELKDKEFQRRLQKHPS